MSKTKLFTILAFLFLLVVGFASAAEYTVSPGESIQAAIDAATNNDVITVLEGTYEVTEKINVNKGLTIQGQGEVLILANNPAWLQDNSNKHLIGLYADQIIISNIKFDSNDQAFGVNTYVGANVILNDVTLMQSEGAGLTVNGATVEAYNLVTEYNAWGAVNVDKGSGVTAETKFIFNSGDLKESKQIWSDGGDVEVEAYGFDAYINGADGVYFWSNRPQSAPVKLISQDITGLYLKIQPAIDAANEGDRIEVKAGFYEEQLTINKSIQLIGEEGAKIIAPEELEVNFVSSSGNNYQSVIFIEADEKDVVIKGFEIDGNQYNPLTRYGGILTKGGDITLEDLDILNANMGSQQTYGLISLNGEYTETPKITLKDSLVQGFSRGGVIIYEGEVLIQNNIINCPTEDRTWASNGIQLTHPATGPVSGLVDGNEVSSCAWKNDDWAGTGIMAYDSVSMTNNIVTNSDYGIYYQNAEMVEIVGNEIVDSNIGWDVVVMTKPEQVKIQKNKFSGIVYVDADAPFEIDARRNYWGSVNPEFDSLTSTYVEYAPWYIDEEMTTLSEEITSCLPGEEEKEYFGINTGVCSQGEKERYCNADGTWAEWIIVTPEVSPVAEICNNGMDDDCDGKIDNEDSDCIAQGTKNDLTQLKTDLASTAEGKGSSMVGFFGTWEGVSTVKQALEFLFNKFSNYYTKTEVDYSLGLKTNDSEFQKLVSQEHNGVSIALRKGWNEFRLPGHILDGTAITTRMDLENYNVETVLSSIDGSYDYITYYNGERWLVYSPTKGVDDFGEFPHLAEDPEYVYSIHMIQTDTLVLDVQDDDDDGVETLKDCNDNDASITNSDSETQETGTDVGECQVKIEEKTCTDGVWDAEWTVIQEEITPTEGDEVLDNKDYNCNGVIDEAEDAPETLEE